MTDEQKKIRGTENNEKKLIAVLSFLCFSLLLLATTSAFSLLM